MLQSLNFILNVDKITDKGEDGNPNNLLIQDYRLLAVFDGMGGAGSTRYIDEDASIQTGAKISSSLLSTITPLYFQEKLDLGLDFRWDEFSAFVKSEMQKKLDTIKPEFESQLSSSLIKTLPSTIAGISINQIDGQLDFTSFWAGDSRNYLLDSNGLKLLSKDDVKEYNEVVSDSPLTNHIHLGEFKINNLRYLVDKPCILFSATDGCFGYYPNPIFFEFMLLDTLLKADSMDEWRSNLIVEFSSVAQDDFSMSLSCFGFKDFKNVKSFYENRKTILFHGTIDKLTKLNKEFKKIESEFKRIEKDYKDSLEQKRQVFKRAWDEYRTDYLELLNKKDNEERTDT
jgi:hypothetical protein